MRKGFTLIELLAVIVILAIIALIATPIVLNIISSTKESSQLRSAEMYLKGVETSVATSTLNNRKISNGTYEIMENGNICLGTITNGECKKEETLEVEMNGETPKSGTITILSGKVTDIELKYSNNKTVIKNTEGSLEYEGVYISLGNYEHKSSNGTITAHTTTSGICSKCGENVLLPGLYDENENLSKSWELLISEGHLSVTDGVLINKQTIINGSDHMTGTLVIDESVTEIGKNAFATTVPALVIIMPNSVTTISEGAFSFNNMIVKYIPDSVTTIGKQAFYWGACLSLESITIPSSVTSIGEGAFDGCTRLTTIYYSGTAEGAPWGATNATVLPNNN